MATKNGAFSTLTEECTDCGRPTAHEVAIEIRTESGKGTNAEFSREPYRVTECVECGATTSQRMNNA